MDITVNKPQGNAQSHAAYREIEGTLTQRQGDVLRAMATLGHPCTSKDIAAFLGCGLNCISGRITELKISGRITKTAQRDGCAVWVLSAELT